MRNQGVEIDKDMVDYLAGMKWRLIEDSFKVQSLKTMIASLNTEGMLILIAVLRLMSQALKLSLPVLSASSRIAGPVLTLPRGPYLTYADGFVFVVEGDMAYKRDVSLQLASARHVLVRRGLSEDDMVIISGYMDYKERDQVRLAGR